MGINRGSSKNSDGINSSGSKKKRVWRVTWAVSMLVIAILLMSKTTANALVGGRGFMWSVWSSAPVILDVCWENPVDSHPLPTETDQTPGYERREWVRLALKRTWEREARILFVGWDQCQNEAFPATPPYSFGPRRPGTGDENIKINIKTTGGGQNPAHGSWGDHMQSGITLNLHCGTASCKENVEFLAIHEFGHALGLYHGEERSDWPAYTDCPRQEWDPSPPWWPIPTELLWGEHDRDSVMAYCSPRPTELSPGDVAGIQSWYGRHIPGTLLNLPGSLCLSSHAAIGNDDPVFGWACDEAFDDQEWKYDAINSALYITQPGMTHRYCLDVDTWTDTEMQIWTCHYGSNQQFNFRNVEIRGYGGLCLTRPTGGVPGAVTMQTCAASARQLWRVDPNTITGRVSLKSPDENLCLTKIGGSGSTARAEPCSLHFLYLPMTVDETSNFTRLPTASTSAPEYLPGDDATWVREFALGEGGTIYQPRGFLPAHCLDVQDVLNEDFIEGHGGPEPGDRVQFFDCLSPQLNQKWSFSGQVKYGNKCLYLGGDPENNGAPAFVGRCSRSIEAQIWDYSW